jgi:hypothetical protein
MVGQAIVTHNGAGSERHWVRCMQLAGIDAHGHVDGPAGAALSGDTAPDH